MFIFQKDSLREILSEIFSALFDSFKKDLKEEMKRKWTSRSQRSALKTVCFRTRSQS